MWEVALMGKKAQNSSLIFQDNILKAKSKAEVQTG